MSLYGAGEQSTYLSQRLVPGLIVLGVLRHGEFEPTARFDILQTTI